MADQVFPGGQSTKTGSYDVIGAGYTIALVRDDIRLAKITTKPRFERAKRKFYHEQIPKAAKMKRILT